MKKYIIILLSLHFFLTLNHQLISKPVELKTIKKVINNKVNELNNFQHINIFITVEPIPYLVENEVIAYIQKLEPKGFIALSADDEFEPILGYSITHDFIWDEDPENLLYHLVKMDIDQRREINKSKTSAQKLEMKSKWVKSVENTTSLNKSNNEEQSIWPEPGTSPTEGWVRTVWSQRDPFNASCPYDDVNGGRSAVGCVATAMGQVINYFAPETGIADFTDSDNYNSSSNNFIINIDDECISADAPDFAGLNQSLNNISFPLDEISSNGLIDEFNFAVGISINMQYSSTSSGAYTSAIPNALINKFGFAYSEYIPSYQAYFLPNLKQNMKNAKPAIMSISNGSSSHAVVVDGFNELNEGTEDDLYHLNYGWGSLSYCYWWNILPSNANNQDLPHGFTRVNGGVMHNSLSVSDAINIEVTCPNGIARAWKIGETYEITWEDNFSQDVNIYLCKGEVEGGGGTKTPIALSVPSNGSYLWTVPSNIEQSAYDYKILIEGAENPSDSRFIDYSDNYFSITDNSINVIYPNNIEFWVKGETYEITWEDNISENVRIDLLFPSSSSQTGLAHNVTYSTESDGSHFWTVPSEVDASLGKVYAIGIQSVVNSSKIDFSDNYFKISDEYVSIVKQPEDQVVQEGQTAQFVVEAEASGPLGYQWWRTPFVSVEESKIENIPNKIEGATTNQLKILNVSVGDTLTQYTCEVKNMDNYPNDGYWVNSRTASLIISNEDPLPYIILQPNDQNVHVGDSAIFTVEATCIDPLGYQWWRTPFVSVEESKIEDIPNKIEGSTTNQLRILNASIDDTLTQYTCEVKNMAIYPADGSWINSNSVSLFIENTTAYLNAKIYLHGCYNSGTNEMDLNLGSNIPKTSPFMIDEKSVEAIPPNVVDWVLIELRETENNKNVVASRSAFLLKTGNIVDLDGVANVEFDLPSGQYYLVIKHRNHLPVMSKDPITITISE